jgi:hypothetical protein
VVAVSHYTFDAVQKGSDPNQNPLCGKKIRATRVDERTGKSVSIDVTVIDRCESPRYLNGHGMKATSWYFADMSRYWL